MTDNSYPFNPGSNERDSTPLDVVMALLSDYQRRRIITELVDDNPQSVERFVSPADHVDPRTQRIALIHKHLPKLREAGVIEWDSDTGVVRRGPRFDTVEAVVTLLHSNQDALPDGWP